LQVWSYYASDGVYSAIQFDWDLYGLETKGSVEVSFHNPAKVSIIEGMDTQYLVEVAKRYRAFLRAEKAKLIKPLDIDKMGEEMRAEERDEIPVKPQGYRGAGEFRNGGDPE